MPDAPDQPEWQRSTFCGSSACVEISAGRDEYRIRGSVNPDKVLTFNSAEWASFTEGVRNGEFDV